MSDPEMKQWVNTWLRNTYGLDDDDLLNAGQVEELLDQAIYDFSKTKNL